MNTIKIHLFEDEDHPDGWDVKLPARWEICDRCEGDGHHSNPSIDGNGLPEEFAEDEEFMQGYMRGAYDVACEVCSGRGRVLVVDPPMSTPNKYESRTQPGLFYWAEQFEGAFVVIQQATGYQATEACDDWFGSLEDADAMARNLSQ